MFRRYMLLLAAPAVLQPCSVFAQRLQGQSFESVLRLPAGRDSLRLWHRYLSDSTLVLLIPREANPCLRRGYEFFIPIGRVSNPVALSVKLSHRDSLTISCTASDYFSSGYRLLFYRERAGFSFRSASEFQLFRSGVERICEVPVRTKDKTDRRVVTPVAGGGVCSYIYHRKLLASYPNSFYDLPGAEPTSK